MTKHLHTLDDVITELGGPEAVLELTGREAASVIPMWRHRKRFPVRTFTIMQAELQKKGKSAPNSLWGMP